MARIGPGANGWTLEGWRYVGSRYDRSVAVPRLEELVITGRGTDPLDQAIEDRLRQHLYCQRAIVDDLWERHLREREAVLELRATA